MHRRHLRAHRGFTRVELLLVVGATGLLGATAAFFSSRASAETDLKQAQSGARRVLVAADAWRHDHPGLGCPTLSQLLEDDELSSTSRTDDPWGSRYRVVCDRAETRVESPGHDRELRTDDDIWISRPLEG